MNEIIQSVEATCAMLAAKRDAAGRGEQGRILSILTTEAEKLKALLIGFGLE